MSPAKVLGSLVAAVAVMALTAGSAAAQTLVGPNQQFAGAVNGNATDANIIMICPGPSFPGQLGHAQGGQGVEVIENTGSGFTGSAANRIVATIPAGTSATPLTFKFTEYGVAQDIPTTALLPCSGTATATFTPLPTSSTARSAKVTVHFLNIAV
jgi:hypothetical protein